MGEFMDLTGKKFGRATVVGPAESRRRKNGKPVRYWKCVCDCGRYFEVCGHSLTSGHTNSCGCYKIERIKQSKTTHGKTDTRLYNVWCGIKKRCNCKTDPVYNIYGGRGIKMCTEWNDFAVFEKWSIENGYDETAKRGQCTIDRIDNNMGYCPENCRWVNQRTQMNNVRYNHNVEYNGKIYTVAELAREVNMNYYKLMGRIHRGIPIEQAVLHQDLRQN